MDRIIIGAGLYGLYAALYSARKGKKVIVLECGKEPFSRATYINQARVHMGYHYPRSLATAQKSVEYFERFVDDYSFCIKKDFDQIYATSSKFSWTSAECFVKFCKDVNICCKSVPVNNYFKAGMCDGAFLTKEYTYDARILRDYFLEKINELNNITIIYNARIDSIEKDERYKLRLEGDSIVESEFVLNATYASLNQVNKMVGGDMFNLKYELCEIILCSVNEALKNIGLTVMDGPFFSIMPFGKGGLHSLTSVTFTPHTISWDSLPQFECQKYNNQCTSEHLENCNECRAKPDTAWEYMSKLTEKYVLDKYKFDYRQSLFSMKPILVTSEVDDSRPTVIQYVSRNPTFVSVLSGKINTIYDLDSVLGG